MPTFTQYHLVDFNSDVTLLQIAVFMDEVVKPLQQSGEIYLSVRDFDRICGHGKTCKALRSCLVKVKGSCSTRDKEGNTKPAKWKLHDHNWHVFMQTYFAFKSMREMTMGAKVLDKIGEELHRLRTASSIHSANNTALVAK